MNAAAGKQSKTREAVLEPQRQKIEWYLLIYLLTVSTGLGWEISDCKKTTETEPSADELSTTTVRIP